MPISSVARADGGTRPLLLYRAYHNGALDGAYSYESRDYNTYYNAATAANRGRLIDASRFVGDAVGTLANVMVAHTKSFLLAPIFRFRHNTVTVASVGDSISTGTGSASGLDSWNRRACYDLSTALAPVVPVNMGYPSQTTTTYLASAKTILAASKPTIAFYFPYSPNDAISTSTRKVQDAMARCADFINFCNTNQIVPILATPAPNNNLTTAEDALRKAIAANVLAMGNALGVVTADFGSVTGDGATPERWLAGLNSDALHPSDAGYEAMTTVAKVAISAALAS
jgi:lysophospholipase L1-like esterase